MSKTDNKTIEVVKDIQRKIINEELKPKDRLLPLRELALEYNTSRSVINSAIHILSTKGYVLVKPRHYVEVNDYLYSGTLDIVKDIYFESLGNLKTKTIREVLDIRKFAELDAINQIIDNDLPLEELLMVLEQEKTLINENCNDIERIAKLDCLFHETLVKMSNHSVLFLLYMSFKEIEYDLVNKFYCSINIDNLIVKTHQLLVDNLKAKNKEKAIAIWTDLLEQGEAIVLK